MEFIPTEIAAIGIILGAGIVTAGCYLLGRAEGIRFGLHRGHRDGHDAAREQFASELLKSGQRLSSAERILAATQAELRRVRDERSRARLQAGAAIEELNLRLDQAQGLNAEHAALLRESANNLDMAATTWESMTATTKARHAHANAQQLRDLATTLAPEQQGAAA
ncbi:hypothetical protein [Azorhizophilus paspali]|uniref:DNA recombination protein RmuC n=1 Tax=Azorhizophilus paspali TaxID=69963 RepID=A0ABV6SI91_AZOPA